MSLVVALSFLLFVPFATDAAAVRLEFVARHYIPAGYKNGTTEGVPDQYGFGFGALERSYYDSDQKLFYGGSEIGFVTITDFATYPENVETLDISFALADSLTDIKICGEYLMYTTKDDPNPGTLHVYSKAMRGDDGAFIAPSKLLEIPVGVGPDNILVSKDCLTIATANEGEGDYDEVNGLVNPVGSVSIIRGPFDGGSFNHTLVSLNMWTEEELLEMGVHFPLSRNAMIYWNATLGVDFQSAIESYTPDSMLEPEYLAFSEDEGKILVNLQENNALVVIDVESNTATDIHPYGLKTGNMVDIIESDGGCANMPIPDGLSFLRSVDGIASFSVNGMQYIVTANEGDDVGLGGFDEKLDGSDIFNHSEIVFQSMTASLSVFDPMDSSMGFSAPFNSACNETLTSSFCSPGLAFSVGTSMVNYSDPAQPEIYQLTGIGGRGVSIYKIDTKIGGTMDLVWDSGSLFEAEGCSAYPWAHNAIADEEFAPIDGEFFNSLDIDDSLRITIQEMNDPFVDGCVDGGNGLPGACPLSSTVDARSAGDGCAPETVVVGEACGVSYLATACEKNSIGFVFSLQNPSSPELFEVFHLSPASQLLNPGLAYENRTLGEIDPESIQFLTAGESPTGNAGILFSGAFSGTISFWQFICEEPPVQDEPGENASGTGTSYEVSLPRLLILLCLVPWLLG